MPFKGRGFRTSARRGNSLHPAILIAIVAGAAILLTVIAGNLLNLFLDDETYQRLTTGEKEEKIPDPLIDTYLPDVAAYPYRFGDPISRVTDKNAVSVELNTPDGTLSCASDVAAYQSRTVAGNIPLHEIISELSVATGYISGHFHVTALTAETPDLRYAAAGEDAALLREFLRAGGSEILLDGFRFGTDSFDEILRYIKVIKNSAENAPVGVVVPLEIAEAENGWEYLGKLLGVCDFCALDLRPGIFDYEGNPLSPTDAIKQVRYYLKQYDMRLLIGETQTELIAEAELAVNDFQILPIYQTNNQGDL